MREPGQVFVSLRASGTKEHRTPFSTETLLSNSDVVVKPSWQDSTPSLSATPFSASGNARFDRLDVTADLDVLIPGNYLVGFSVSDGTGRKIMTASDASLGGANR